MNSGKETIQYRYLVIGNGNILVCCDTKAQVESYIQKQPSKDIAVYQRRYVSESVLCAVGYEDELYLTEDSEKSEDDTSRS